MPGKSRGSGDITEAYPEVGVIGKENVPRCAAVNETMRG
jgi:hypothetical protein